MGLLSRSLAFKQAFSNIDIETSAWAKIVQAVKAYYKPEHKPELARSAELFLESWRILRDEYESGLYKRFDSLPVKEQRQQEQSTARENKGRMVLSLFALHDLAMTCSRLHEEYKDKTGKCKLDVCALRYGWKGNTTTEVLEIEEGNEENDGTKPPWPKGSGIAHVLPLKDPLGRLLEEANSFKEAAFIIANICSLQVASVSEPLKEYQDGCDFIRDSLYWMRLRTSMEIESAGAASDSHRFMQMQEKTKKNSEDDEDERTRKKLVLKINDWESKKKPLDKKEEEELSDLFDQLHVTSLSELLICQLERFHITDGADLWPYKGESFEHIQEEKKNDSDNEDEEEERPLLRGG